MVLHARDQPLNPLIDRPERVFAQHGALRLVVEFEMYPVDGEITSRLLRGADELTAQPGPGGLWGLIDGLRDFFVGGDARGQPLRCRRSKIPRPRLMSW